MALLVMNSTTSSQCLDANNREEPMEVELLSGNQWYTVIPGNDVEPMDVEFTDVEEPMDVELIDMEEPMDVEFSEEEEPMDVEVTDTEEPMDVD